MAGERFNDTTRQLASEQADNPAAPLGQRQTARAGGGGTRFNDTTRQLAPWLGADYIDQAQTWYTGANTAGTTNGWNTAFQDEAAQQQKAYLERANDDKDSASYFDWLDVDKNPDATGVATWNDETKGIVAGDVFKNGEKVANLYDENNGGFDKYTADVMMSDFLMDVDTKKHIFRDSDRVARMGREIAAIVDSDTLMATNAGAQKAFNDSVDARQEDLTEGWGDEALVAGGAAAAGGLVAGGVAVSATGVGAPLGLALIGAGAAFGGISSWLNKDQLTEITARAIETTSIANAQFGRMEAFSQGVKEFSGVGLKLISPFSNMVQGSYDATRGKVGDGKSEFYELDEDGKRQRSGWLQAADVVATLGDSMLQFSSGVGIGMYMTGTGVHVAGAAATLAQTGAVFNDRQGGFDDVQGKEWASAVGSIGIDVVQFGMAGAIAKAGAAGRTMFAAGAETTPGRVAQAAAGVKGRLFPWGAEKGTRIDSVAGMRYKVDKSTNEVLDSRASWTLLAPSETLRWVAGSWRARIRHDSSNGALGPDDYYRAAVDIAGGKGFGYAVINGWAEGSEEAVQAVLDPWSMSADMDYGEVTQAFFYGMAAGAGMSLGAVSRPPPSLAAQEWRARSLYSTRNNVELNDEQWREIYGAASTSARKRMAKTTPTEDKQIHDIFVMMEEAQTIDRVHTSSIGAMAAMEMEASRAARDLANINPVTSGSLVLMGRSGDHVMGADGTIDDDLFAANAGVGSALQIVRNLVDIHSGQRVHPKDLARRLEQADLDMATATETGVADEIARVQQTLDALATEKTDVEGQTAVSDAIRARLVGMYESFAVMTARADAEAAIDEMNDYLASAFLGELVDENGDLYDPGVQEYARRAVEMKMGRQPYIDAGSFGILMPQISKSLTWEGSIGTISVQQATLKALGGDHDGDFEIPLNTTYFPPAALDALRMGIQYIRPSDRVPVLNDVTGQPVLDAAGEPVLSTDETYEVITEAPKNEPVFIDTLAEALRSTDSALRGSAVHELVRLRDAVLARYSGELPGPELNAALVDFDANIALGDHESRLKLVTALVNAAPQKFAELGRASRTPEVLWLMQRISLSWDSFQKNFAANHESNEFVASDVDMDLSLERQFQKNLSTQEAATDGQTAAILLPGTDPVRDAQHLWYSVYRAAVGAFGTERDSGYVTEQVQDLIELFSAVAANVSQSEMARVTGRNAVQKRVVYWLEELAKSAMVETGTDHTTAMMLVANTQVRDVKIVSPGKYEVADGDITMLQLMLKKSVEIERGKHRTTIENDEDLQKKLARLDRVARRDVNDAGHSVTAHLAFLEVFGHVQVYELLGDSSKYLGPQLTLNQLVGQLANVGDKTRDAQSYRWKRKAPYALHTKIGNPPYTEAEVVSGQISSYKVLVDAVVAAAQKAPAQRKRDNDAAVANLTEGLTWLHSMIVSYRKTNVREGTADTSDIAVLRLMLDNNATLAGTLAALIPDAAKLGAFQVVDSTPYAADWVMEFLVERDVDRAAVMYKVNSAIAEWNQMGGNVDTRVDDKKKKREPTYPRSYSKIKSRLLQTFYHLAQQPDGFELDRLVVAMHTAPSIEALEDQINAEPMWRGDHGEQRLLYDDVALYEADPADIWTANLPGTLQREALAKFSQRTQILSVAMAEQATELKTEQVLINDMLVFEADRKTDRNEGKRFHGLLELAILNRRLFPDGQGRAAREQLLDRLRSGLIRMQDKGKADRAVAPYGDTLVLVDEWGVKQSVFQELDALTMLDPEDVKTNLTKLVEGPVRVGLADGSSVLIDLSTPKGVLAALKNKSTNAFAKAVVFATVRDVNSANVLQTYQDVSKMTLKTMLEEQTFADLVPEEGKRLSVAKAHKLITTVEAGARKRALSMSSEEQEAAAHPIMKIISDIAIAYTHRAGAQTLNQDKVRDELVVDVAMTLLSMAVLDARDGGITHEQLNQVATLLKAKLKERALKDSSDLQRLLESGFDSAVGDINLTDAVANSYARAAAEIRQKMAVPGLTQEQIDALLGQQTALGEVVTAHLERLQPLRSDDMVMSVINMFTPDGLDAAVDLERKAAIVKYMGAMNRVGKFQGDYRLIDKVNALLAYDPLHMVDDGKIKPEEWSELGAWAATVYIAEMAGRSGSSVSLTPLLLGKEGEQVRKLFDVTFGSLIDGFLNPHLLKSVGIVVRQAKYAPIVNAEDLAGQLETTLFNEKKIGSWSPVIVSESLKARRVLKTATVGLAIPTAGEDPKDLAAYVGAGWNLFKKPTDDMLTPGVFTLDQSVGDTVVWTPEQFFRINNHFAGRVMLRGNPVDSGDAEIDLMPMVGQVWFGDESVKNSGYQVISIERLNKAIAKVMDERGFAGDVQIEIDYFDADTKPFERDWVNNVYFDGVGRESAVSTGPGPVAEMVFGNGALSKTGQQNPLDMATKGGHGYRPILTTALAQVLVLEATSPLIGDILRAKALHMLGKEYDTGYLLPADSTALYKAEKQRHIVVGMDANGVKGHMWSEEAIKWQSDNGGLPLSDPSFPLQGAKLVPLTDSQAQTLLGEPGTKGLPGVSTPMVLNMADMDPFPSLDAARLKELRLTRLGEESTLEDSPFANMEALAKATYSEARGAHGLTRYEEAIELFRGQELEIRTRRTTHTRSGETSFDTLRINKVHAARLKALLDTEAMLPVLARLKIPFAEIMDLTELNLTKDLLANLQKLADVNPSSVIFRYVHNQSADPAAGVLSEVSLKNNFEELAKPENRHMMPTFEDIVILEMDPFVLKTNGNMEEAYQQAKAVARQFAQRGVTIVLAHGKDGLSLRSDLAAHLSQGAEGYAPMAESTHFFSPVDPDSALNQTQRALESTLTSVQYMTGKGLTLRALFSKGPTSLAENNVHVDLRDDTPQPLGKSITLLPTEISATAGGSRYLFGRPVEGTGPLNQQAQVRDRLLPILRSAKAVAQLKKMHGGDPKGALLYRVNPNGTVEQGIRSFDDAIARLLSILEANGDPLEPGREAMAGDFDVEIGNNGELLLARIGFKLPGVIAMRDQLETPFGFDKPTPGERGARITISVNELQKEQTIRPGPFTIDAIEADPLGGTNLLVTYNLSKLGKTQLNGDGFKNGLVPMPNDLAFPETPLSPNGLRVTQAVGRGDAESKHAVTGTVNDFGWAFALSGINFEQIMVKFLLGDKVRSKEEQARDWLKVSTYLTRVAQMKPGYTASEIAEMMDQNSYMAVVHADLNRLAGDVFGSGFVFPAAAVPSMKVTDPIQRLGQVMIATLMAPRIRLEHVISTSGMMSLENLQSGAQVGLMPQLFTDMLSDHGFPELRKMLFSMVNLNMPRNPDGSRIYQLNPDWTFTIAMANPLTGKTEKYPVLLQVSLDLPADENPVNYVQSRARSEREGVSPHSTNVIGAAAGGRVVTEGGLRNVEAMFSDKNIARFGNPDDGGFWSLLHAVPDAKKDKSYLPWNALMPLQRLYMMDAGEKVVRYQQEIVKTKDKGWETDQVLRYHAIVDLILYELNMVGEDNRGEVDHLVRQFYGIPARRPTEAEGVGDVSPDVAFQAVSLMLKNVQKGLIPTYGGVVPLPHETFLDMLHSAQAVADKPWAPMAGGKTAAGSWDEWVTVTFGQVQESNAEFHSMYRQDLDGFMHTYQGATASFGTVPVSMSTMTDLKLMDKETHAFIMSLDPNKEFLLAEPIILETMRSTLNELVGHPSVIDNVDARGVPVSDLAKQIERTNQWLHSKRAPRQEKVPMKQYLEQGAWYQDSMRDTHNFFHSMVNLSIGMRLLNPALWTSAIFEVFARTSLETLTDTLTGQAIGPGGKALASIGEKVGWETKFSRDQISRLNDLAEAMGVDNGFLGVVYDELMYRVGIEAGRKKFGSAMESFAKFSAMATSDPRFGFMAKSLAKRYILAAWEYLDTTDSALSVDQFISEMNENKLYLRDMFNDSPARFSPHRAGLNQIAQVRSVKSSVSSKLIMGVIDSLTRNPHMSANGLGTLLKIPFVFTRFNANALTTMTGMGGPDQLVAMFLDRRENKLLGHIKAGLQGVEYKDYQHDPIDMSDVIEGVDLVRPFLKGAITHTGLMMAGMMAGSLGLSGEDEEDRRRRRLATYLGTPYYYDPRTAENDFRFADAIWLDSIPGLNMMFKSSVGEDGGRSAVVPHWIFRQFLSPVIGIERFFSTGDARQIKWGFSDAFAAIPTTVTRLWNEADLTADMLLEASKEAGAVDTVDAANASTQFLINMVGVYERALLENSMVNAIRSGSDKYNRNPWILPATNGLGEYREDKLGNPVPTDALTTFRDPETGEVRQGYTNRDDGGIDGALIHQFAENNATAAMLLSLFTGQWSGDSSYLRENMAVSQQKVQLPQVNQDTAEALVIAALKGSEALPNFSQGDIEQQLKTRDQAAGKWWVQSEITAEAKQLMKTMGGGEFPAMSMLDKDGREVLTKDGARGIYTSLANGLVELGDPSLTGVFIPWDMRAKIEDEWVVELVQDGVNLGLDETAAKYRAKRIWFGNTFEDPTATGLRAILWSNKIPVSGKVVYNQLNTTYMLGPDGRPWATPFKRTSLLQAFGIPLPHTAYLLGQGGLTVDDRGNTVDNVVGINTGLAALERVEQNWKIEPREAKELDKIFNKTFTPDDGSKPYKKYGYTPYKRSGYSSGGGGGGYFSKMYSLPDNESPYANDTSFINTSNPIIRRAFIRRERVWSERGRLKQWQ